MLLPLGYIHVPMGRSDTSTLNRNVPLVQQEGLLQLSVDVAGQWHCSLHTTCDWTSVFLNHEQ